MKRYRIVYDDAALHDLADLELWIGSQASRRVAADYVSRIRAACGRLRHYPQRGATRDDVRPGVRILGFGGRVNIAFEVENDRVVIIRVLYGGRQFGGD